MNQEQHQNRTDGMISSLARGLRHLFLNKANNDYLLQLTGGSEEYWDRMIAAQGGWPGHGNTAAPAKVHTSKA